MAVPFKVFDYERYDGFGSEQSYCLRCETWVPTVGPFSGGLDPHIEDHLVVYGELQAVDREISNATHVRTH